MGIFDRGTSGHLYSPAHIYSVKHVRDRCRHEQMDTHDRVGL